MVCDYPQIITEVRPPGGQKGVWDNSHLGFHSSRQPGIGYRGVGQVVFWYYDEEDTNGYCVVQAFIEQHNVLICRTVKMVVKLVKLGWEEISQPNSELENVGLKFGFKFLLRIKRSTFTFG